MILHPIAIPSVVLYVLCTVSLHPSLSIHRHHYFVYISILCAVFSLHFTAICHFIVDDRIYPTNSIRCIIHFYSPLFVRIELGVSAVGSVSEISNSFSFQVVSFLWEIYIWENSRVFLWLIWFVTANQINDPIPPDSMCSTSHSLHSRAKKFKCSQPTNNNSEPQSRSAQYELNICCCARPLVMSS